MKFLPIDLFVFQQNLKFSVRDQRKNIWDPIRKKYLILTPEEWIRQLTIQYLIQEVGYNPNRMQVEKKFSFNQMNRRFDLLVYNQNFQPWMLVECKSPDMNITQSVFDQILSYNYSFQLEYLFVTNGKHSIACKIDLQKLDFVFLDRLPNYE